MGSIGIRAPSRGCRSRVLMRWPWQRCWRTISVGPPDCSPTTRRRLPTSRVHLTTLPAPSQRTLWSSPSPGMGLPNHQLSPFDFQPDEPGGSSLHLDELASAFDRVPTRQLIVVLDCCFADGFGGARVFAPVQERAPVEDRSSLLRLSGGSGRIVLTASNAGEPALEAAEYGHGLLTYYIIKALQSSPSGSRRRTWSTYRSPQRPTTPPRLLPPRPRVRGWSAAPDHPPRAEGWR